MRGPSGYRASLLPMVAIGAVVAIVISALLLVNKSKWPFGFEAPLSAIVLVIGVAALAFSARLRLSLPPLLGLLAIVALAVGSGVGRDRVLVGPSEVARLHVYPLLLIVGVALGLLANFRDQSPWRSRMGKTMPSNERNFVTSLTCLALALLPAFFLLLNVPSNNTIGRPIRGGGYRRPVRSRAWRRRPPPSGQHREPSTVWATASQAEADSVTAFNDLAARLARAHAPTTLIDRCLVAAAEEARHARICHRIARSYDRVGVSAPVIPSPVVPASLTRTTPTARRGRLRRVELARLAVESFVDGVIGEHAGADDLATAARIGEHGAATSAALQHMAAEEQRHAQLGGDITTWALAEAPVIVAAALRATRRRVAAGADVAKPGTALSVVAPSIASAHLRQRRLAGVAWLDATLAAE